MAADHDQPDRPTPVLQYQPWYAAPDRRSFRKIRYGFLSLLCLAAALFTLVAGRLLHWPPAIDYCAFFGSFSGAFAAVVGIDLDDHHLPAVLGLILNVAVLLSGCLAYLLGLAR